MRHRSSPTTPTTNTGILQLHVRHPEEDRRITASLQPQGPEPVCSMSNIQDGNNQRHISSYTTVRLDDIYRPFGCFPSHTSSSLLSTLSPLCMERGLLSVQNNSLWPLRGPLPVHKTHQVDYALGSFTEYLSHQTSHTVGSKQASGNWLDFQPEEIRPLTNTDVRASRFCAGHNDHDGQPFGQEVARFGAINSAAASPSCPTSSDYHESHNANSIGHICSCSCSTVLSSSTAVNNLHGSRQKGLGCACSTTICLYKRMGMVEGQSASLKWSQHLTSNARTDHLCRCQRHWLGLLCTHREQGTTSSSRLLDARESQHVHQLERVEGSSIGSLYLHKTDEYDGDDPDRQHYITAVHQQARRNQIPASSSTSHSTMEVVSSTRDSSDCPTHTGSVQSNSQLRVSPLLSQESMANSSLNLQVSGNVLGPTLYRPLRRSNYQPPSKIPIVDGQPGIHLDGRLHDGLEPAFEPIYESTMESDRSLPSQDRPRLSSLPDNSSSPLDSGTLVSTPAPTEHRSSSSATTGLRTAQDPFDATSITQSELEALSVVAIRSRFSASTTLNVSTKELMIGSLLADNSINRSYMPAQRLFVLWAHHLQIDVNNFHANDLISFLSDLHRSKKYQVATLLLARSAVTNFHVDPHSISSCDDISQYLNRLKSLAPPIRLHRPTIDLTPTFNALRSEDPAIMNFAPLQRKLAFLLAFCLQSERKTGSSSNHQVLLCQNTYRSSLVSYRCLPSSDIRVSVRSLASSLALCAGIPKEDIVIMGNYSGFQVFKNHYRREQMSKFDFSNSLLSGSTEDFEVDEEFFDAVELAHITQSYFVFVVSTNSEGTCFDTQDCLLDN
ncbi:hypothetical protein A0J61_09540 [Choanephora cucurbitarum]|uniref:Uncharacterized protein n=1 Tax=Choanephora cucurbitarum TaxID=101091 RepID=A0A1C7N016_9FUNG|nr:hypothetical protein A0J61_09540 [Choanephora cucurbitarum]